ncbi:MAG: type II secretion system protein [Candidatus Aenigmarchaeota archaeon]|nr:type II secretion system protein [Candidatus Aenigmarchaeota archaeon]
MLYVKHLTLRGGETGFSLIELLITMIITSIAFFGLAMPFIAERSSWGSGKRLSEAQRDAQMITRAIARVARESNDYSFPINNPGHVKITFATPCGNLSFEGGESFNNGQLHRLDECVSPTGTAVLIDGVRSRVSEFAPTTIVAKKLVRIRLNIAHKNISSFTNEPERNEILNTDIFLRNNAT